jgi:peptidoglycan-N-acetylglucosamine deacetylase
MDAMTDTDVSALSGATPGSTSDASREARPVPSFALTFGDGPGPSTLPLLDCLRHFGVKCTFFILGSNVEQAAWCGGDTSVARSVMLRALAEGHILGNHTYSHMSAATAELDLATFRRDLLHGEAVVRSLLAEAGMDSSGPVPFSLPFGPQSLPPVSGSSAGLQRRADPRLQVLADLGRPHLHWTVSPPDWAPVSGGAAELARQMIEHIDSPKRRETESIIALHDSAPPDEGAVQGFERPTTVQAVRLLLEHQQRSRWHTFTLSC